MRILTFNWHTPYISLLARLPHQFEVAPPNIEGASLKSWDAAMRPQTPNIRPISRDEMRESLAEHGYYDLILCHNVKDIVMARDVRLPKILVFHNRLSTEAELGKKPEIADSYRETVRSLITGVYCVFISQTKRYDWGLPGEIIMPGVDVSAYGGYTGETRRVLRIGNSIRSRDLMTGYSLQEEVLKDIPNILIGENPDIPGCRVSESWDALKQAYRENRVFINTAMPPWEDGYNLGMLEAMATGMPVVSVANPTSPLTDGVDGFVCSTADEMRRRIMQLLDDAELARQIGEAGRVTAERLFPMDAFLARWSAAIDRAVDWYPGEPKKIFGVPAIIGKNPRYEKKLPNGKNIILSYTSYPATAAAYLERAFRENHNVLTVGCKISEKIIDMWNLRDMKSDIPTHDIHTPDLTVDVDYMLSQMPEGFDPDMFIWVETGLGRAPAGLEKLSIPKAAYLIDTHIHFERDIQNARNFDVVFLAQRAYIPEFHARGIKNVHWLPLGCDPEIHGKRNLAKEYDIGFVGSIADERRARLLLRLAERANVRYQRLFLREMGDFFCRSRIVFNNAIKNDLNMRVFEAMCAGSLLLTDNADGLTDFFTDREHLVIYGDDDICELADRYLTDEVSREKIAESGMREVLAKHTYRHRADDMVKILNQIFYHKKI